MSETPARGDYVRYQRVPTRWADNDVYGHVNNVVYYAYFDTAINQVLIGDGGLDPATQGNGAKIAWFYTIPRVSRWRR